MRPLQGIGAPGTLRRVKDTIGIGFALESSQEAGACVRRQLVRRVTRSL